MKRPKITLGNRVKDKVSGFVGIAISKTEYLNGCIQYGVQPQTKESDKKPETEFFDAEQLEVLKTGGLVNPEREIKTGGGHRDHPKF